VIFGVGLRKCVSGGSNTGQVIVFGKTQNVAEGTEVLPGLADSGTQQRGR